MTAGRATPFWARALALLVLFILSPALLLLGLVVRLDSRGPVLFRQRRMGYGGKAFTVWKIRTMTTGSERATALGTRGDGSHVTRVGRVLRKLKLDELPQLWNVVQGEMAFIGPRPIPIALYEELCRHIPDFPLRNSVPPGLTNLSQISLADNKLGDELLDDWRLRFEGELHYIRNKNPWYDLTILLMTGLFVLRRLVSGLQRPMSGLGQASDSPARSA
jgi:lipopolysaccharide/colanic/teichoic acid biosynthesis glycosyltransferase